MKVYSGVVLLITDVILSPTMTIVATAGVALTFLSLWLVMPVARRIKQGGSRTADSGG